jgi:hypothetical protein
MPLLVLQSFPLILWTLGQFYVGQTKIILKELTGVRRETPESVEEYLNRFRLLKARCFTQVPKHELVEMAAGGF